MAYFDDAISGSGQYHWGDNSVGYVLIKVTTRGSLVTELELAEPDHALRIGWISFFYRGADIDATETDFYSAPIWIDFDTFWWHPDPSQIGSDPGRWYARGVRWSLTIGTEAYMVVG